MADREKEEEIQELLDHIDRTLEPYTMTQKEAESLRDFMRSEPSSIRGKKLKSLDDN